MRRILLALVAIVIAASAHAVEMGDDGLHKTDWMRDTGQLPAQDN